jgi:hypothetical protein
MTSTDVRSIYGSANIEAFRQARANLSQNGRLSTFDNSFTDRLLLGRAGWSWAGSWSELYTDKDQLAMLDVARNADGRLEVFGVNGQGHIWHTAQTQPGGPWAGSWSELYTDKDNLSSLRVAANADGRLEVFGVNAQGHIWHTWQT